MPEHTLQSLGVLVTRPAHQAEGLCQLLEQAGATACRLPLIEITAPDNEQSAQQILSRLVDFDLVIFISANAVSRCYLYIGGAWPEGPEIACVGRATARQLQSDFGREPDVLPRDGYDSEALLAMPALQAVQGKKILILKGEGGRKLLSETLADRGADVSYANLYRRQLPAEAGRELRSIQQQQNIDVVIFTSGEGIDNLLSLLDETSRPWLCQKTWLVIHPRLAEHARQAGCDNEIIISAGPSDEQIMQCLTNWAGQQIKT